MNTGFWLGCAWIRRAEEDDAYPGDPLEASPLMAALERFVARHEGHVDVHAGPVAVRLDLRADISLVFEELPDVLRRLAAGDEAELYFPEAGSDLVLRMRRRGELIRIAVRRGDLTGSRFADLPPELPPVEARDFLAGWQRCLNALLDAVLECEPLLASDPGYRSYARRLNHITVEDP